jgi:hypothetical protein
MLARAAQIQPNYVTVKSTLCNGLGIVAAVHSGTIPTEAGLAEGTPS